MLVLRWQAPIVPDKSQIESLYVAEGLEPHEERYEPNALIEDHRHPFDEVITVVSGEAVFDIAGNKLLLRVGDRIVIPSNTRHSFKIQGDETCSFICANKMW